MRVLFLICLLFLLLAFTPTVYAQTDAPCQPNVDAQFTQLNPNGDYLAWACGASVHFARLSDGMRIDLYFGQAVIYMHFDNFPLAYNLYYGYADGSNWQINVQTHQTDQIGEPPPEDDGEGGTHGEPVINPVSPVSEVIIPPESVAPSIAPPKTGLYRLVGRWWLRLINW